MKNLNSKLTVVTVAIILGGSLSGWAAINFTATGGGAYDAGSGTLSTVIPDNNLSGLAYALNFADTGLTITPGPLQVTLNISGGYNGDLTVYLSHGADISYLLTANPATGGSGYSSVVFGTGTTFNNLDPSGSWTLFIADTSPGDNSTLTGFDVTMGTTMSAVPEPVGLALGLFAAVMICYAGVKHYWVPQTKTKTEV